MIQIVKDVTGNPLQANSNQLINKIQYYAGDYGIGDAATSLAWNNFADYFVDNFRGVVCRLAQDGITPISITNNTNAFFVATLAAYRQDLNNGVPATGVVYSGNPCIYGVFDANTNKYIIAMEEINRYLPPSTTTTTSGPTTTTTTTTSTTTTASPTTTTTSTTTTAAPTTTTTAAPATTTTAAPTTTTTTTLSFLIGFGGDSTDACNFSASGTVTGDNPDFCSCTTFTGAIFAAAPTGLWFVSFGGQYVSVSVINGNPVATVTSACSPCFPAPTTTTTTTTTTTAAPTTTTTSTTSTTTTTTAASTNFLISAGYAAPNECSGLGGPYPNSVYGNSSVWYDPGGPYVTRFFTDSGMTTPFNGGNKSTLSKIGELLSGK